MDNATAAISENSNSKNIKPAVKEPSQDLLKETQKQVDELINISRENVGTILERGEKLSDLNKISEILEEGAGEFQNHGIVLKRKEWRKRMKIKLIFAGILSIVFIIIICEFICMIFFWLLIGSLHGHTSRITFEEKTFKKQ